MSAFRYLQAYPDNLQLQVQKIIDGPGLGEWLKSRHSESHTIRTDSALYNYVMELKNEFLRQADPINKVSYDSKLQIITCFGFAHHHLSHSRQQTEIKARYQSGRLVQRNSHCIFANDCCA